MYFFKKKNPKLNIRHQKVHLFFVLIKTTVMYYLQTYTDNLIWYLPLFDYNIIKQEILKIVKEVRISKYECKIIYK